MSEYSLKIKNFIFEQIKDFDKPKILEFGVKEGRSTKLFLDVCNSNNGELISIDIRDYSKLFDNPKWKFIQSRDDNFDFLNNKLPQQIDIIYLDSLHEANHVEKIFNYYYKFLKIGGHFYIDDISWLPYLKNKERNNFYCEINNKETFEKLLSIYNNNIENFDIDFSFISSGICRIVKKEDKLNKGFPIKTRQNSIKNLLRIISKKLK